MEIQEQFNKVIKHSQMGIPEPNTDLLFSNWAEAKKDIIQTMKGELIWEYPEEVTFELSYSEKVARIDSFILTVRESFCNDTLALFINSQRDGFFSNQVVNPDTFPANLVKGISKGMKLLKAFKFFEPDEKKLYDIQTAASMIIQEDKVRGRLCFSVHPLDFLSLSENHNNWRSCTALDGEFRDGTISYMGDKSCLICYLRGEKRENLPNFPSDVLWNSKKWRVLLFFSDDNNMVFASRQYPFDSSSGMNFVLKKALPLAGFGYWQDWENERIKTLGHHVFRSPYYPVGDEMFKIKDMVHDAPNSMHYNDLTHSTCYEPIYAFKESFPIYFYRGHTPPSFNIGSAQKCFRCGKDEMIASDTMLCLHCELEYGNSEDDMFAVCDCCGQRYLYEEGACIYDHDFICPNCFDEYCDVCPCCGEVFYTDDMKYDEDRRDYYCLECASMIEEEDAENGFKRNYCEE